jgi:hypothetical protein
VKPGELERNLSRLVEVARSARERLVTIEREMTDLRHDLETLAARSVRAGAHADEPAERPATMAQSDPQGANRHDAVPRPEGDLSGPEAGSE